jgi:hypothetical protein
MWMKRDRGQNWTSRRHGWIMDVTRVPVLSLYVGLSLVEAESGSLFDTQIKSIIPRGEVIHFASTRGVGLHCSRAERGTDYKNQWSMRNRAHRRRYPPLKANRWGHVHSGGEVTHKPILKIGEPECKQHIKRGREGT